MNTSILDRPIAFHRCFVTLTGSVNAALMLSQAVYWQKRNKDGAWWFQTQEKWEDETGLTRREQETARKALRGLPFWKEELRGLPGKLYFFLDLELLLELVAFGETSLHKSAILDCTNHPNSDGGTSHTTVYGEENKEESAKKESAPSGDGSSENPPPPTKPLVRERNKLLDALVAVDGSDPLKSTSPAFKAAAAALKTIREVSPDVTPEEITRRAKIYRMNNKDWAITPTAIAKYWGSCDRLGAAKPKRTGIPNL